MAHILPRAHLAGLTSRCHAVARSQVRIHVGGGVDGERASLRLSECGGPRDPDLDGYVQLRDAVVERVFAEAQRVRVHDVSAAAVEGFEPGELLEAHELLRRLERRQLYRFGGSVVLIPGEAPPDVAEVLEELASISDGRLGVEDLRADYKRIHHGHGGRNPLSRIRFFDQREGRHELLPTARAHASTIAPEAHAARLPGAFEEVSLRLFVTDESVLEAARQAFRVWCERRELCDDACEVDELIAASQG
jgi:hypothetical protein